MRLSITFALLVICCLVSGCGESVPEKKQTKTIVIGDFRFSGTAESGQYAPYLFKLNRLIRDEMSKLKEFTLVESDRTKELGTFVLDETDPDGLKDNLLSSFNNEDKADVDYLMVGEMDGFSLTIDDRPESRTVSGRKWLAQSRVSLRIVDVQNKQWLTSETMMFNLSIPDTGSAEAQINNALATMASRIVGLILLNESGMPKVAAVNADSSLVLNRGSSHGIYPGQVFSVAKTLQPVSDPETGNLLKGSGGHRVIGDVRIVQVTEESCIARFQGSEAADIGDLIIARALKIDSEQGSKRQARAAMAGFVITRSNLSSEIQKDILIQLEDSISHRLQEDAGLIIVQQANANVKKLITQQVITDINQGREPGLPLGTLRGVDYLMFGNIHSLTISPARKIVKPLSALGVKITETAPSKGFIKAQIYIQDVNTGQITISEELDFSPKIAETQPEKIISRFVTGAADAFSQRFLLKLRPLTITSVTHNEVMLNHGKAAGLAKGMKLSAYSQGEKKRSDTTGQILIGQGSVVSAQLEIIGFSPHGWARALVKDGVAEEGMPVTMPVDPVDSFMVEHPEGGDKGAAAENKTKRIAIAKISATADGLSDIVNDIQNHCLDKLVNDSGFDVIDQKPEHIIRLIQQYQLEQGKDKPLPKELLDGADYLFYGNLEKIAATAPSEKHVQALDMKKLIPGRIDARFVVNIQKLPSSSYFTHRIIDISEPWKHNEKAEAVLKRLVVNISDQSMAEVLQAIRPLAVDWVEGEYIGINHGKAAGISMGDILKAYSRGKDQQDVTSGGSRAGIGSRPVGTFQVTEFSPEGLASAKQISGKLPEIGARLKRIDSAPGDAIAPEKPDIW